MKQVVINGTRFPLVRDPDITQYGRDLEITFGKGGDVDWTAGLGHGYMYSHGFDASLPELRLGPTRITLAVPELKEKHGGMAEIGKPTGTVAVVADSSTTGSGDLTITDFNIAAGDNAIVHSVISVDTLATSDYSDETSWPTFGGVRMQLRETSSTGTLGWMWFYLLQPTVSATGDMFWTNPNNRNAVMTAIHMTGVQQVDPFGPFVETTGSGVTASATQNAEFDLVIDVVTVGNSTLTALTDQTDIANNIQGTAVRQGISTQPNTASDNIMSWTLGTSGAWKQGAVGILKAEASTFLYTAEDSNIHKHTITSTATALGAISEVTAPINFDSGDLDAEFNGSRPFQWLGVWYFPAGAQVFTPYLSVVGATTDTWLNTDVYSVEMVDFQDGATPEVASGFHGGAVAGGAAANRLSTSATTSSPLADSTFAEHGRLGDISIQINAVTQTGGFVLIGKQDTLLEIDRDQVGRPVVPPLPKGNLDTENGKYTTMWGDICLYPRQDALWGYLVGRDSFKMGIESLIEAGKLPRMSNTGLGVALLHGRRPYSPVLAGTGFYYCQATSTTIGATIYLRKRREYDPPGDEFLQHMLWDGDRWKGGLWDSSARMVVKEATSVPANRGLTSWHTGADGSPNTATRRGEVSTAHYIEFHPLTPAAFRNTQLRAWEVVTANTWDATTSLELAIYRDEEDNPDTIGSLITSAGVHVNSPTVTALKHAEKWTPVLYLTTNGSYLPITFDPHILRMKLVFRTEQITRLTIPATNEALAGWELNYNTTRQLLQRLMNQGPVAYSPDDQYGTGQLQGISANAQSQTILKEVVRVDERGDGESRVFDVYVAGFEVD